MLLEENERLRSLLRECEQVVRLACEERPLTSPIKAWDLLAAIDAELRPKSKKGDSVTDTERAAVLDIVVETARVFEVTTKDILSNSRKQRFVQPRQVAMYVARHYTAMSFPELGRAFGRDHTTIQHACGVVRTALWVNRNEGDMMLTPKQQLIVRAVDIINRQLKQSELRAEPPGERKRHL